jgi:hypothetical protein
MWLNYMRKVGLLKKLYGAKNNIFFITNRYEYLSLLNSYAGTANASTLLFERKGQFSNKFEHMVYMLNEKMTSLRAANQLGFKEYLTCNDRVYFTLANDRRDNAFLVELGRAGYCTLSTADSDSLYINKFFIGLFGNNDSPRALHFFLQLFQRASGGIASKPDRSPFNKKKGLITNLIFSDMPSPFAPRRTPGKGHWRVGPDRLVLKGTRSARARAKAIGGIDDIGFIYDLPYEAFAVAKTFKFLRRDYPDKRSRVPAGLRPLYEYRYNK